MLLPATFVGSPALLAIAFIYEVTSPPFLACSIIEADGSEKFPISAITLFLSYFP